jgi:hypothetical protein
MAATTKRPKTLTAKAETFAGGTSSSKNSKTRLNAGQQQRLVTPDPVRGGLAGAGMRNKITAGWGGPKQKNERCALKTDRSHCRLLAHEAGTTGLGERCATGLGKEKGRRKSSGGP